jgi:uncharacterized repeat protein (TIGR03803 family)
VFKISADGVFTNLHVFDALNEGASPDAGLVEGRDGYFYGTTSGYGGSTSDHGTVFKISAEGAFTRLYSFSGGNDGGKPKSLVQGRDGYFYGTTETGGRNGYGTVFRLSSEPAAPEFLTIKLAHGVLDLTWRTELGAKYQLQYNSELNSSNWISLGQPQAAAGLTLSASDYITNGLSRFYRAVRLGGS